MNEEELEAYVKQSQSLIESSPQMDEQNTRRKLIEPLIELLDWEILSPDVELEYSVQMGAGTKKVDYALMLEDTPVVFVETKGLDSTITDSHRRQLTSYMRQTGVDWGLLTNGKTHEILKRQTEGRRPNETTLGTFSLEELPNNREVLRTLSKSSIESGEAEKIAKNIEATQQAAESLRKKKDGIAEQITELITREIGETVTQTVEASAKNFVDTLAQKLESEGRGMGSATESTAEETVSTEISSDWSPSEGANAIAGTILRSEIEGNDDTLVAVFPTKKSGVDFLKENNAWGFVRVGRDPKYVAMYVSEDVQEIKYVGKVSDIVSAEEADLARPIEFYSEPGSSEVQAGFDTTKDVILFEPGSLFELEDPVPYGSSYPMSLQYATLGDLKGAETTNDVL